MIFKFLIFRNGLLLEGEGCGDRRDLYAALLRHGIKADQALLAALDVLTHIKHQSPYACYGEGFTIISEAC